MELFFLFINTLLDLSNAMAPYILFGLFFAGILHELVPESLITKHLGKESVASVIKSTIFGIPSPVCSCGVIPLATSIKRSGGSKGATLSFLISTPITGVDSILVTYGMFGWVFTLYRVFTSMIIAMLAGILTNLFDKSEEAKKPGFTAMHITQPTNAVTPSFSATPIEKNSSYCPSGSWSNSEPAKGFSIVKALKYAFAVANIVSILKP